MFGGFNARHSPPEKSPWLPSVELMNEEQFWSIIEEVKESARNDYERQYQNLAERLHNLNPQQIILFANRFRSFRGQSNNWKLWGAIYIIQGGCDEYSFKIFREWVIGQGEDFYYRVVKDPETLAELEKEFIEETSEFEGLELISSKVFKELTGQEMPYLFQEGHDTVGNKWEDGELTYLFPKIYTKYPHNI